MTTPAELYQQAERLYQQRRDAEAEAMLQKIISETPYAPAYHLLGTMARWRGDFATARLRHQQAHQQAAAVGDKIALEREMMSDDIYANDLASAWQRCEKLLAHNPTHQGYIFDRGIIRFLRGEWAAAWADHEARLPTTYQARAGFNRPFWQGEELTGKKIYLFCEQGYGDAIHFIRFAVWLKQRGAARVIVECDSALVRLFLSQAGVDVVVPFNQPMPAFHYHLPIMSIPHVARLAADAIPNAPYLQSVALPVALPATSKRVALCWRGKATHSKDRLRSASLKDFLPLLALTPAQFFAVHGASVAAELALHSAATLVHDVAANLRDFADTAAWLQAMDLVITVDTAVAHLAGALGKKVWLLIPPTIDWRWGSCGTQTLWYPSMTIYRQQPVGSWDAVINKVVADLRLFITS